jgi:hypothetical protein
MSSPLAAVPARPGEGGVVVPLDARRPRAGRPAGRRRSTHGLPAAPTLRLVRGGARDAGERGFTLERFLARAHVLLAEAAELPQPQPAAAGATVLPLRRERGTSDRSAPAC